MSLQAQLVERVESVVAEAKAFHARLSPDQRALVGQPDAWSPKDTVAHIAMWNQRMAIRLTAAAQGEEPPRYADYDAENALDFYAFRDWSWEKVLQLLQRLTQRLVAQITARDDDALRSLDTLAWQDGRPLWRMIAGTACLHAVDMHLAPMYVALGYGAEATALVERSAAALAALDDAPAWRGVLHYNQACHYVRVGQSARALKAVGEALSLAPSLATQAREDPDLAPLRGDPALVALLAK